ncbi:hypothetical protein GCM10023116_21980 [Kistimonas scapharcae]|uniref:Phage tail protein n=1 Tax=Kistimonas scapharcae TaxID=1036133 RepID=A0ABP8V1V3_9GAMM
MQLTIELDETLNRLTAEFKSSPEKVSQAIRRTMTKLSRFSERQVLRELSRRVSVSQALLKNLGRVKVTLEPPGRHGNNGYQVVIWVGLSAIPAHYLGNPRQTRSGVRVGRRFWQGAFLLQPVNSNHAMVFKRAPHWQHRKQISQRSGKVMWMGLPIEKQVLSIYEHAGDLLSALESHLLERFTTLLQQELNFAFNIEGG